jgi:hypothetical protein
MVYDTGPWLSKQLPKEELTASYKYSSLQLYIINYSCKIVYVIGPYLCKQLNRVELTASYKYSSLLL